MTRRDETGMIEIMSVCKHGKPLVSVYPCPECKYEAAGYKVEIYTWEVLKVTGMGVRAWLLRDMADHGKPLYRVHWKINHWEVDDLCGGAWGDYSSDKTAKAAVMKLVRG